MDSSDSPLLRLIVFGVLLAAAFAVSAFESALDTIAESIFEEQAQQGRPYSRQLQIMKDEPTRFLLTARLLLLLEAVFGAEMLAGCGQLPLWGACLISAFVFTLVGSQLPLLIGRRWADAFSHTLYPFVRFLMTVTFPVIFLLIHTAHGISRIFGVTPGEYEDEVTEDEIISMVNEGHEQGVLDEHETKMIRNIFELDDKEAHDIMTHRRNISAISAGLDLQAAIAAMTGEHNSRFPVYEGDIDNIIGVLHLRDAMVFQSKGGYDNWLLRDIPGLLHEVTFIPETRRISSLFRSMQAKKLQMVIVVDEYGGTAGLVTMEDMLEEIVGNILDEYDRDEKMIVPQEDGSFILDGLTPLDEAADALGTDFGGEDFDTLNGYLIDRLDHIPGPEDVQVTVCDRQYAYTILQVEDKMIRRVRAAALGEPEDADAAGETKDTQEKEK